jgi:hypothetical protein
MSAFAEALARALAAIGGPAPAAALVVGGVVVGALGGGFLAANDSRTVTAGDQLAVYACPGTGSPLVNVPPGQRMLATGRTEDSVWVRIHNPDPARPEAWVHAALLTSAGDINGLPVSTCLAELAVAAPSFEPQATFTPQESNAPTPSPSPGPTATPAPTAKPTPNSKPDLGSLTVSPRRISFDTGDYCPNAETTATFRVRAEDTEGIQSVALFWREPGAGSFARLPMTRSGGSIRDATWTASLDTQRNGINRAGSLAYYAVATDTGGATRRLPANGSNAISVEVCRNDGPDITQVRSSGGSPLFEDPFGVSRCRTATNITATVRDPQGVDSVRLFYRRPADSGYQSKPMDLRRGSWFANLDTLGDRISINDPPTGTLRWYIQATDDEGESSRIDTRLVTIRRCDSEADFGQSSYGLICTSRPTFIYGNAADPDGIGPRSAVLVYTYLRADGTKRTARKQMTGNNDGRWYYQTSLQAGPGWNTNRAPFRFYIETTDRFGGTSRGGSGETDVTSC